VGETKQCTLDVLNIESGLLRILHAHNIFLNIIIASCLVILSLQELELFAVSRTSMN
jgi:hypothetical protein